MTPHGRPRRVPDLVRVRAARSPGAVAHDDTSRVLTFAGWDAEADEVGGGLASAGVSPGDRVLLPVTNAHAADLAVAYIAVQRAGAICVPVNTRWAPAEVEWYTGFVEARWAVTDRPDLLPGTVLERVWDVRELPRDAAALPDQQALDPEGDADILATSGTTGRPKGVVSRHAEMLAGLGDGTGTSPVRTIVHAIPFTGYGGCHATMLLPLRYGTTVVTQPAFEVEGFLRLAADRRADALMTVPAMLRLLVDSRADVPLPDLRWIMCGTAPLPRDTLERAAARWPHARVVNLYGATEAGLNGGTQLPPGLAERKPGSVGRPAAGTRIEVRAPDGRPLPPGDEGEVWIHSAAPPRRYWKDPEATAATWQDGWLRTGDLGILDGDGDLTITGRRKEIIIRGGYNIAPAEVEDALHRHPAVAEAAVTGIPHPVLGEDVAAVVVARTGASVGRDELRAWLSERLADYKVPRRIVLAEALPRNAMGKVVKAQLAPLLAESLAEPS